MKPIVDEQEHLAIVSLNVDHIDASNSKILKKALVDLSAKQPNIALNLAGVSFVDSSGCGAILSGLRACNRNGGDLKIFEVSSPVRILFEMVRLHRIVELLNHQQEALDSFAESSRLA